MATFWVRDFREVVSVRQQIRELAEALDAEDSAGVEQVVGELAANCVEHRSGEEPGQLSCGQRGRWLIVRTWNRCDESPDWETSKDDDDDYPVGGHGLLLAAALSNRFRHSWMSRAGAGFVATAAVFALRN